MCDEAEDRVIAGPSKRPYCFPKRTRNCGIPWSRTHHCWFGLSNARVVHKVTIVPRGHYCGGSWLLFLRKTKCCFQKMIWKNNWRTPYGRRVAEEIISMFRQQGRQRFWNKATQMARWWSAEVRYEWKKWDLCNKEGNHSMFSGYTTPKHISEQTAYELDSEVRQLLNEAFRNKRNYSIKPRESRPSDRKKHYWNNENTG